MRLRAWAALVAHRAGPFLEVARKFPDALVLGRPLFDQSAPKSRVYGRRLSQGLFWEGVPVVNLDTRVRYYPGGISHFDVLWDDLRLAWLYARLVLGKLARARGLLVRHVGPPR